MRKGWKIKKLDELFEVKSSKRVHKADWKTEGVPFYRAREVVKLAQSGCVENELFISEDLYQKLTKEKGAPKIGDIIISAVGTLGQCYLVKKNDRFYFKDASVLWFENKSIVNAEYVEYAFKSDLIMRQVMYKSMGATVGTLTISRAKIIQIPIPPLPEQKQIVEILDQAFEAIDRAKANIEKNIENANELFQSKLNEIFSHPSTGSGEAKGEGWVSKELSQIGVVQTGYTPPTKDKSNFGDFIPFAKPPHFKPDGSIVTGDSMLSKVGLKKGRLFKKNSILMVCIGATIGKTGFSEQPISSNQQINALTPNESYIPKLLYYALISPYVQNQVLNEGTRAQATLPIINKTKWMKLKVNLPNDRDEQLNIVNRLDKLKKDSIKAELLYSQKLTSLEELKKSILQKAFSGELTN